MNQGRLVQFCPMAYVRRAAYAFLAVRLRTEAMHLIVAKALEHNTTLTNVAIIMPKDHEFSNLLLSSLPSNESIEVFASVGLSQTNIAELLKNVAQRNSTLKRVTFYTQLTDSQTQEVKSALGMNHTLEYIVLDGTSPFGEILQLNKAGRRYLAEDATSRSKCIAVLAKVKHDLDCLYYHMQENPILCTGYSSSDDGNADKN